MAFHKIGFVYAAVAGLDLAVAGLFYGPNITGTSLRWISGFDDGLPIVAILLFMVSTPLLVALGSFQIRQSVARTPASRIFISVISAYVALVVFAFASMWYGGV